MVNHPDEIYNLAAMSHVAVSFEYADGTGTLRILEAVRTYKKSIKLQLYGKVQETPLLFTQEVAYWITVNYREAYGILFNHESPVRGETFVTRAASKIALGLQDKLYLGNLDAKRDYVRMILQADEPEDWTTVRDFVRMSMLALL